MAQRRKKPRIEGLATHDDPESCGHGRKAVPEALTGVHAGRVLSREIEILPGAEAVSGAEGNIRCTSMARCRGTWRGLRQTPSMRGSAMCENREALWPPAAMAPRAAVGSLRA